MNKAEIIKQASGPGLIGKLANIVGLNNVKVQKVFSQESLLIVNIKISSHDPNVLVRTADDVIQKIVASEPSLLGWQDVLQFSFRVLTGTLHLSRD